MNDYKAFLPNNLVDFSASSSTSSSSPGLGSLSGSQSGKSTDRSFSQELSRASERGESARDVQDRPRRDKTDSYERKPKTQTQETQRRDQHAPETTRREASRESTESASQVSNKESTRAGQASDDKSASSQSTSQKTTSDKKRAEDNSDNVVDSTEGSNQKDADRTASSLSDEQRANGKISKTAHAAAVASEVTQTGELSLNETDADALVADEIQAKAETLSANNVTPEDVKQSAELLSDKSTQDIESEKILSASDEPNQGLDNADLTDELASSKNATDESSAESTIGLASEAGAEEITSGTLAVDTDVLSMNKGAAQDANQQGTMPTRIAAGEQLSPGQLANRQAQLFNAAAVRKDAGHLATAQATGENSAKPETEVLVSRSSVVAGIAGSPLADTVKSKNNKTSAEGERNIDAASVKPLLAKAVSGELSNAQAADLRAQAAEVESANNLATTLAARQAMEQKAEQQLLQGNMAQVRQMAQQQVQNLSLAVQATSAQASEGTAQSSDNMFLSMPGGIVTAPQIQRLDTGNTQTINAPINMPILQNDADKAMAGNIRWMVNEGVKNAVVNVTPSGMGPISVSIGIEKDQMNVSIVALQGSTREALDNMLPRLKEQLATQGHDSVRVDISDGRAEQSDRGYGQLFGGDQNESSQDEAVNGQHANGENSDKESGSTSETSVEDTQGVIGINEYGAVSSRYDIYV